jgi:hypothetical protein
MADDREFRELLNDSIRLMENAVARAELFRVANTKSVITTFNGAGLGTPFDRVRDSVHKDLCLALAMLFETRDDSLSFWLLLKRAASVKPQSEELLQKARALLDEWANEPRQKEIKNLRNRVIAHIDVTGKGHDAKYGDEMKVLEAAIQIHGALTQAFGSFLDVARLRKGWAAEAEKFWDAWRPQAAKA